MFEERRHQQQTRTARISPIGWDKSYPLEPVQVGSYWLIQMFEERRHQLQARTARISPIGWDKSYLLEPVQVSSYWLKKPYL
jgi:hypothetical protein